MSQAPFSKSAPTPNLSFHQILDEVSQGDTPNFSQNLPSNFEWNSVVENTILLSQLFSEELATPQFPSRKAIHSSWAVHRYAASARGAKKSIDDSSSKVVNKSSQENVPQPVVNPLWNILVRTTFEKINAPEIFSLNPDQQRLSVFFTAYELKKIYRQRAKIAHPDQRTGSHLLFIELKKNYQILVDFLKKID